VVLAVSVPVDCDPEAPFVPDQPPLAVQEVALVADQVSVELSPFVTVLGLLLKPTVGAVCLTETVADCIALPPAPVQDKVYVVLAVSAPVDWDPLVAFGPAHPPEAVQAVALVADQVRLLLPLFATLLGLAVKLTVGTG